MGTDLFRCEALSCRLSTEACGRRYLVATRGPKRAGWLGNTKIAENLSFSDCNGCPTGANHAGVKHEPRDTRFRIPPETRPAKRTEIVLACVTEYPGATTTKIARLLGARSRDVTCWLIKLRERGAVQAEQSGRHYKWRTA